MHQPGGASAPPPPIAVLSRAAAGIWFLAACAIAAVTALSASGSGDYSIGAAVSGDNAGPGIEALVHGRLSAFLAHQPLMGLTSILLRLPVAIVGTAAGAGSLTVYRLGALACLLPAGLLAGWLVQRSSSSTKGFVTGVLAAVVILAGPATAQAVTLGHPEEVLAATLATAAVIAALLGRATPAALLLGLAIGTKQWTLVAAAPVLLAADGERRKVAVIASVVGIALAATAPLADPAAFTRANSTVFGGHLTDPFSIWWPFGSSIPAPVPGGPAPIAHHLPLGLTRSSASAAALTLSLAGVLALSLRRRNAPDPLALLALLGLMRCLADPTPLEYNFVDVLIPLAAWETVSMRRLPIVTLCTAVVVWLVSERLVHSSPALISAMSVIGAAALAYHLATCVKRQVRDGSAGLIFRHHEPITGS